MLSKQDAKIWRAAKVVDSAEFRARAMHDLLGGRVNLLSVFFGEPKKPGSQPRQVETAAQGVNGVDAVIQSLAAAIAPLVVQRVKKELATAPAIAPRWLNMENAAKLMGTSKAAVRSMARSKLFPIHRLGGRVMIDIRDLEKALAESTEWLA